MTVKFNKSNTYTIYNRFETHNNLQFSRLYRNTYFNNFGISVFKNEEEEKIVLVLTKAWSQYTSKIYALDLETWRKLDDSLDDESEIDALNRMIKRFF